MSSRGPDSRTGLFADTADPEAVASPAAAFAADATWPEQLGSPKRVELFAHGASIGWLGENNNEWCIVAAENTAVSIRPLTAPAGLYFVNATNTARFLSVGRVDQFYSVGFYRPDAATTWSLQGNVLKSNYSNAQLSYWSAADQFVYANSDSRYTPLTVEFHDVKVSHVFVLMLENHSFDNLFAFSGIDGLTVATPADSNQYDKDTYHVGHPAPTSMPTDPGHEFLDVVEQLTGLGAAGSEGSWATGQDYPPITNAGFVSNFATTKTEIVKPGAPRLPTKAEYGDVMMGFDTPRQLPVLYQLATEFAICDQWFSSLPGPTWPNRFFVHGASSGNWDDSPDSKQMILWHDLLPPGGPFAFPNGSIYDQLDACQIKYRIYQDPNGPLSGRIPQVTAIKGVSWLDSKYTSSFADDLRGNYPYAYTFIEPNYGDTIGGSYRGGSSQHPMDGMARGEALIKEIYEALRSSPLWATSLLVITYDEHGGFYDSAKPPRATPPSDGGPVPEKQNGFKFDQYGPRVPAIVVSPRIPKGTVDHTVYDHTSILATLHQLWDLAPLTQRDKVAADVLHLLSATSPRTDCPTTLSQPVPDAASSPPVAASGQQATSAAVLEKPLPQSGNVHGFLAILLETDIELTDPSEVELRAMRQRVLAMESTAEANAYAKEVIAKVEAARAGPV